MAKSFQKQLVRSVGAASARVRKARSEFTASKSESRRPENLLRSSSQAEKHDRRAYSRSTADLRIRRGWAFRDAEITNNPTSIHSEEGLLSRRGYVMSETFFLYSIVLLACHPASLPRAGPFLNHDFRLRNLKCTLLPLLYQ